MSARSPGTHPGCAPAPAPTKRASRRRSRRPAWRPARRARRRSVRACAAAAPRRASSAARLVSPSCRCGIARVAAARGDHDVHQRDGVVALDNQQRTRPDPRGAPPPCRRSPPARPVSSSWMMPWLNSRSVSTRWWGWPAQRYPARRRFSRPRSLAPLRRRLAGRWARGRLVRRRRRWSGRALRRRGTASGGLATTTERAPDI